ncbi:hypothetical protein [Altibacter sp. HG106]|uniref:hypothetical protein n=1 Tax=Altibacter sp. HG106 TaxID=3023937 RepID=UPI002350C013|nr:hypothetical protein [Altibacter sp. HG106]MDC7995721.1 hypothetical protein [Altibacter sp. HG106]
MYKAQPITFESMRRAKEFAKDAVAVTLLTTQYEEDKEIIPNYFEVSPNLTRSVLDVGSFSVPRKLPLLRDILERAVEHDANADYIIYTNTDIALQPQFYLFIKEKIEQGLDAFVINRRTIASSYSLDTLAAAYSAVGVKHPGFDCFVFKSDLFANFDLQNVCIGASKVGITLLANLIIYGSEFQLFEQEHLTFHLGEDKIWQNPKYRDYFDHNCRESLKVYDSLKAKNDSFLDHQVLHKHWNLLQNAITATTDQKRDKSSSKNKFKKLWRRK